MTALRRDRKLNAIGGRRARRAQMERAPSPATPLRPSQDVIARHLGEGAVLVHLPTNRVYELNHTGARVWELIGEGVDFDRMVQTLAAEFDMDPVGVSTDVTELIDWLRDEGLLES